MVSHAILGATLAYVNGGNPAAGGTAAVVSEAAATYFTNQYKDDPRYQNEKGEFVPNLLPEDVKTQIRDLTTAIGAVAGGTVGDSAFNAQLAGVVGQNAVENNELYSKRETKNGTEFYYDQDDIEFNLLQYQVAKGLLSRDEVPNSIFEKLDGTLSLDTGGTTIHNPSKESFSILFDREIAANRVITDEEYNKLISENPQIVAKIQAETGLDFSASQSNDYVGKIEDIESNSSIADGARAVQSFMNDRVADITDVRDNGDSGGMVVGAAISRPFLSIGTGVVNGVAGLVILGTDSHARAETWSGIKTFAEHPIDNTSTALTNYWNNTSWNQMLEDGFVAGYGAGLGGGAKIVSKLDTSPIISIENVPSQFGQAGQFGITLTPNPKLDVADTKKAVSTGNNKEVISVDFEQSKIKGTPESVTVNNLKPNAKYELSNGTKFETNAHGYVEEISFTPDFKNPGKRDIRQTNLGKLGDEGDVGGHIQACVYGGTCDAYNLFPQNSNFNNSAYKVYFENIVRAAEKSGKTIGNVTVKFTRNDPGSLRPDRLKVTFNIDGDEFEQSFKNEAGGGK